MILILLCIYLNTLYINIQMSVEERQEYIMQKIQELVPDIRNQVHSQIIHQLNKNNNKIIDKRKQQIKAKYSMKLQEKIGEINNNIKIDLQGLKQQYSQLKNTNKHIKKIRLCSQEQAQIVQNTVENILQDEDMVKEIKAKMHSKLQEKVIHTLQITMANQLQTIKNQHQQQYRQQRQEWEQQRNSFWKKEAQRQLQELAQQYKELQYKKTLIQQSLQSKKAERESVKRKYKALLQHNTQVAEVKRQIKMLS